ncbi:MAG: HNH endonuclease [Solimonas sp.]
MEGWPYSVSSDGRVRNDRSGHVLKPMPHKSGYLNVQLWRDGTFKCCMVHVLVATAFLGPKPSDQHEVAHGDGNRHNSAATNLRWALHVDNMRDRDRHGTTARGKRNGKLKHSDEVVDRVRQLHAQGLGSRRISKALGMSRATVHGYIKRTRRPTKDGAPT